MISNDFHAHHSPFGAHSSFTLGRHGVGGGFGLELGRPADQEVYVAYSREGETPRALPFFSGYTASKADFALEDAASDHGSFEHWRVFSKDEIDRSLGWTTDAWSASDLTFRLLTPFGPVADPATAPAGEFRLAILPAILSEITLDNRDSDHPAWTYFGIGTKGESPLRLLSDTTGGELLGVASGPRYGLAVEATTPDAEEILTWNTARTVATGEGEIHRLVGQGGLLFRVPPRTTRTFTVALGFYLDGTVTSGIPTDYLYTQHYADLEDVLRTALTRAPDLRRVCTEREAELAASDLNADRQFLLAHATHSYFGSTQLLRHTVTGQPLYVVNEGEYRMMNTFDLTVDHLFFELRYFPWAVRNVLDQFVETYSYEDTTQNVLADREPSPGGISFTHDMGIANQFTPPGWSSYELADKPGCFSHMTHEQLVNFILCATLYGLRSPDPNWLGEQAPILARTFDSLLSRDHPDPGKRTGIMLLDSSRCGTLGQEITTYDSLDSSLGQARQNVYLAVKTWAACVALSHAFRSLDRTALAEATEHQAALAAATIVGAFDEQRDRLPAVIGENEESAIIPAIEGLVFPWFLDDADAVSPDGRFGPLVQKLATHIRTVLVTGTCIDAVTGGWKISSTSQNTWMSKIALSQFVHDTILGITSPDAPGWDRAHAKWQQTGCADWAFVDQVRSHDGHPLGSKYYPRGVTMILWLDRHD